MLCVFRSAAQFVQGVVSDATTGETLPTVHVYYVDDKSTVVQTDINGKYKIAFRKGKLIFSMMGFEPQTVEVKASQRLNIKLRETASSLQEVTVTRKRTKYQRKNNPAVDMMRKVIEAKKATDLRQNDYLSYMKYEKMTFALNEFTEKVFQDDHFKRFQPFFADKAGTESADQQHGADIKGVWRVCWPTASRTSTSTRTRCACSSIPSPVPSPTEP